MKLWIFSSSKSSPMIGVWWWTGEKIIGTKTDIKHGVLQGANIQYSDIENHMTLWSKLFKNTSDYNRGYKSIERGRVYYDTQTCCYYVICGERIIHDPKFRKAVLDFYNLNDQNVRFNALAHYAYTRELTGNDAVDTDYYTSDF